MPDADDKGAQRRSGAWLRYASAYHAPVLCDAVVQGLVTDWRGVYVDATLGGGGHAAALLDALDEGGRVVGIDQDADALEAVGVRLHAAMAAGRLRLLRGNFGNLGMLLDAAGLSTIDGLLLDLGVSSHQLDTPVRGFSHRGDGRLDMRMDDRAPLTADEVVNRWDEAELRRVLRAYGEEPRASPLARRIVASRPVETTRQLADLVRSGVPSRDEQKTLARVFQGIRIAVNDELGVLERVLEAATRYIRPGGRLAIISYHSLEDRRVKRYMRAGNLEGEVHRDLYGNTESPWRPVTRQAVAPDDAEIAANPRARSARLRLAERI
ncbi:MAG: 16S rRNA (cytosine(1402)-N(4))-methyltransferase RsmH [Rhodothermales bacterium]|nr:16S rRNA (cytosine(1402)-N(4))-methyltransferase RsmH [Rhodothermales bacterium]